MEEHLKIGKAIEAFNEDHVNFEVLYKFIFYSKLSLFRFYHSNFG